MSKSKIKHILVSFSGGLDSTYLVYSNLKKGHIVTGLYTTIENNKNKVNVEKHQIKKLQKLFEEDFPGQFKLDYGSSFMIEVNGNVKLSQIFIWLTSLLYKSNLCYDEICIGAVMNDDLTSYLDDIKRTWASMMWNVDKKVKLTFPLSKTKKWEIANSLPKKYKDLVVYCENPEITYNRGNVLKFKNCNECDPCLRYNFGKEHHNIEYGQIKNVKNNQPMMGGIEHIPDIEEN